MYSSHGAIPVPEEPHDRSCGKNGTTRGNNEQRGKSDEISTHRRNSSQTDPVRLNFRLNTRIRAMTSAGNRP